MRDSRASGGPSAGWLGVAQSSQARRLTDLDGQDDEYDTVVLPFDFGFYGRSYRVAYPSTNGIIAFGEGTDDYDAVIPDSGSPAFIAALWADLDLDCAGLIDCGLYYAEGSVTSGATTIPYAAFAWHNVSTCCGNAQAFDFELVLYADGRADLNYRSFAGSYVDEGGAIGIQDHTRSRYVRYLQNLYEPLAGRSIRIYPPGNTSNVAAAPLPSGTPAVAGQPLPPTDLVGADAPNDSGGSVVLTWTPSTTSGVTEQRIYMVEADDSSYELALVVGGGVNTATISGLYRSAYPDTFVFVVRAFNGTQESQNSNVASATPVDNTLLPPRFDADEFSTGTVGEPDEWGIDVDDGSAPYSWTLEPGSSLPPGLSLYAEEEEDQDWIGIVGIPASAGTYTFTLRVTDAAGRYATRAFTLEIEESVSLSLSSVVATPLTVAADGTSSATVTVTARSSLGAPIQSASVYLYARSSVGGGVNIAPSYGYTDVDGVAVFTVTSYQALEAHFLALVSSVQLVTTAPVRFTGGTPSSIYLEAGPLGPVGPATPFTVALRVVDTSYRPFQGEASVTISIAPEMGPAGAVLGGTLTRPVVNGFATFTDLTLSLAGAYVLSAQVDDLVAYVDVVVDSDTTPPAPPAITSPLNGTTRSLPSSAAPLILAGTAEPNATVSVRSGEDVVATALADGTGAWSVDVTGSVYETATFIAYAADAAGNTSRGSSPVTVHLQTRAPSPVSLSRSGASVYVFLDRPVVAGAVTGFNVSATAAATSVLAAARDAANASLIVLTLDRAPDAAETVYVWYVPGDVVDPYGNAMASTATWIAPPSVGTPLTFTATIDGQTLTVTFARPIVPASGITGFTVRVNGVAQTPLSAARAGTNTVLLTLATAVHALDTVTLSYAPGNVFEQYSPVSNPAATATDIAVDNYTSWEQLSIACCSSYVRVGETIELLGQHYPAGSTITFEIGALTLTTSPATVIASAQGSFLARVTLPPLTYGTKYLWATSSVSSDITASVAISVQTGLSVTPASGPSGTVVTLAGTGFYAGYPVTFQYDGATFTPASPVTSDASGSFSTTHTIPAATSGYHSFYAATSSASGYATFQTPAFDLSLYTGQLGDYVTVSAHGFSAGASPTFTWNGTPLTVTPAPVANADGEFFTVFRVPTAVAGTYTVAATGAPDVSFAVSGPSIVLSPASGVPGAAFSMTGRGFPASSALSFTFGGAAISPSTAVATDASGRFTASFVAPITSASGAKTVAAITGAVTGTATYTVATPYVSVSGATAPGVTTTVNGSGFPIGVTVTFTYDGGASGITPVTASATGTFTASFSVPTTAAAGSHTITATGGVASANGTFNLPGPSIEFGDVSSSFAPGETRTLYGSGWVVGSSVVITLDGGASGVGPFTASATGSFSGSFTVPTSLGVGTHTLTGTGATQADTYTLNIPTPTLSLSPTSGPAGRVVTLSGSYHHVGQTVSATFDGAPLTVAAATVSSSGSISGVSVTVPTSASVGAHTITVNAGTTTASVTYTVLAASATATPTSVGASMPLTLSGLNFTPGSAVSVTWDGPAISPSVATASSSGGVTTSFVVPASTTPGAYTVTVATGSVSATVGVTVIVDFVVGMFQNTAGELGDGTTTNRNTTPVQTLGGLGGVVAISAGSNTSAALRSDGTVWVWGYGGWGQFGNGATTPSTRTTPAAVPGLSGVTAIAVGGTHVIALKSDGSVWAWGDNTRGQVGDGTTTMRTTPVAVSGLGSGVVAISAGTYHGLALKSDGTVVAWGEGEGGQLGDGSLTDNLTPGPVTGLTGITRIAAGGTHNLALKSDGTLMAWGHNYYGEIGDGTSGSSVIRSTPVAVLGLTNVTAIAAGVGSYGFGEQSLAVKNDGTVWAWGANCAGQVGNGTTSCLQVTPQMVSGPTSVVDVAAGGFHSVALTSDGRVWTWGSMTGATAVQRIAAGATAIDAGHSHFIAIIAP